jgi:hypothetical protein
VLDDRQGGKENPSPDRDVPQVCHHQVAGGLEEQNDAADNDEPAHESLEDRGEGDVRLSALRRIVFRSVRGGSS